MAEKQSSPTSTGHSKLMEQKEVSMVAPKARRLQLKDTLPRRCRVIHQIAGELLIIDKPPDMKIGRGGDVDIILKKQESDELTVDKLVCQEISGQKVDKIRWIHRLDMATSGVLCIGLSKVSSRIIMSLFADRKVTKNYVALIKNHLKRDAKLDRMVEQSLVPKFIEGGGAKRKRNGYTKDYILNRTFWTHDTTMSKEILYIDKNIAKDATDDFKMITVEKLNAGDKVGRRSRTKVVILKHLEFEGIKCTKVLLIPVTGRRHQLRLHLKSIGHPILGDYTYDRDFSIKHDIPRMFLHARSIRIPIKEYKDIRHTRCKGLKVAQVDEIFCRTEDEPF